nr:WG repeat-containing protein [Rhodothermus marinus]
MRKDGRWGFVDREGREVVGPAYEAVQDFAYGWRRWR